VATIDKNFKVKNGLVVALGGTFGGTVEVGTPTENSHATTKEYVDSRPIALPIDDEAPSTPSNGDLWFDSITERINVYYNGEWISIATLEDAEVLQDHIHDTSIDGNGLIVSTFVSGGSYDEPGVLVSAGGYDTTSWEYVWDGGSAVDNFN
jgi:hypothetical protein